MQALHVTLETVTPLFLSGADGKTPELRPASFRGGLRFWLRTLLGAQVGVDLKALQEGESRIFGSTDGASPVVVRTAWNGRLKRGTRRALPHSDDRRKQFSPPAFVEGSQFELTLATRPGQRMPSEAVAALLLMLNLGGLGKRTRRGFGSLQVAKVESEKLTLPQEALNLLVEQPEDGEALAEHLTKVLDTARSLVNVGSGLPYAANALPDYPVLSEDHALVLVCQYAFTHAEHPYAQAMVDFWKKALRHDSHLDNYAYGHAIDGRRASPLLLHLSYTKAGYHLVLTAFRSAPLPAGELGWKKVKNLLKTCRTRWHGEYIFGKGGR